MSSRDIIRAEKIEIKYITKSVPLLLDKKSGGQNNEPHPAD
jgi:hypothetical protein